jgi:choline dehydrogenase-like flavoprotein
MAHPALQQYQPKEYKPGPQAQTDRDLIQAAGEIVTTIFHPTSSARMGKDATAPLTEKLQLRGIEGLRVVNASAMPCITSGNTNAPTIMIAEKAADFILNCGK